MNINNLLYREPVMLRHKLQVRTGFTSIAHRNADYSWNRISLFQSELQHLLQQGSYYWKGIIFFSLGDILRIGSKDSRAIIIYSNRVKGRDKFNHPCKGSGHQPAANRPDTAVGLRTDRCLKDY
ncbi:hypothetical protein D3C80_1668020 [compost metagenome]